MTQALFGHCPDGLGQFFRDEFSKFKEMPNKQAHCGKE